MWSLRDHVVTGSFLSPCAWISYNRSQERPVPIYVPSFLDAGDQTVSGAEQSAGKSRQCELHMVDTC